MTSPAPSPLPPTFDAQALILKATRGGLRPGEANALSAYIRGLERQVEHKASIKSARNAQEEVTLCLNRDMSALVVQYPGVQGHTVALPLAQPALAIDFLTRSLRERRGALSTIGSPGAPTQHDLALLARAGRVKPRRVGKVADVSLEDLGL